MMESPAESDNKPQFTCGECDQTFPTAGQLNNHHSTHTWKQCFQCNLCSYTTTSIDQMKKHAETHSNRKKFANTSSTLDPRGEKSDQKHDNQEETIEISDGECADSDGEKEAVILIESDNEQEDGRAHTCREEIFAQLEDQRSDKESATGKVPQSEQSIDNSQSSISNASSLENKPLSSDGKPEQNLFQETVERNNVPPGNRDSSHQSRNIFAQLMGDFSVATLQPSSAMADCITSTGNERQQSQTSASPDNTNSAAPGSTAETTAETTADPGADIQCEVVSSSNSTRKKKKKEKKLWTCECGFTSYYLDNLRRHLRKGSCAQQKHNVFREKIGPRRHECSRCPFWAPTRLGLVKHQKAHLKTYFCSECPFQTKHTAKLKRHAEMHKDNHIYSCSKCSFSSDHRNILTRHKKLHEVDSSNPTVCQKTSKSRATEPELFCSMCSFTTREGKYYLLEHQAEHYEDNRMRCDQCDLVTMDKRNFQSHLWTHDGQKPFKCTHCPYRTAHAKSLDRHKKNHNANLPFQCHLCSFSTKGQSPLSAHMNVHGIHNRFDQKTSATSKSSRRKLDDLEDHCSASETNDSLEATEMETPTQQLDSREAEDKDSNDDGENFNCKHCSFYAKDRYTLLLHAAKHYRDMIYRCDQCDFKSRHSVSLKEHLFVHLGQKPYVCTKDPKCPFVSAHQGNVRSHMKAHSANFPLKCKFCTFTTVRQSVLTKHHRLHKQKPGQEAKSRPKLTTVYKCKYCEHTACSQHALMCHQAEHKNLRVFQCNRCQFFTNSRFIFRSHKNKHLSRGKVGMKQGDSRKDKLVEPSVQQKPFSCSTCSYTTDKKYLLLVHEAKHSGEKAFRCDECEFSTLNVHNLSLHLRAHERRKFKRYKCDECPYVAERQRALVNHTNNHKADLPFKCKYCSYTATRGYYIRVHTLLHIHSKKNRVETEKSRGDSEGVVNTGIEGDDPETSHGDDFDIDGKVGSEKTSKPVPGIRLVMTGSGQYKTTEPSKPAGKRIYCDYCDHSTTRPRDMKVHVRLHTGERPYACPDCPFRAIQSHHLQKHRRYHQANLAEKCKLCTFSCRSASLLRSHVQLHNDKKNWHRCPHCSFTTSSYRVANTHIRKQHVLSGFTVATSTLPVKKKSPPQQDEDVVSVDSSKSAEEEDGTDEEELNVCVIDEEAGQSPSLQQSSDMVGERLDPAMDKHEADSDSADDSEEQADVLSVTHEEESTDQSNTDCVEECQVKCDQCEHSSATHVDHLIHLSVHTNDKTILCDQCDYTTSNESLFKEHWQTHTSENQFKCDLCSFIGTGRANLLQHQSFHSAKQALKCRWCSFSCSERQHLENHRRLHGHGHFKYKCQYCHFNTDNLFLHLVHKAKHSSMGIMKCNMCKTFETKDANALKEHLKEKHNNHEHFSKNLPFLRRYKGKVYAENELYGCKLCPYKTIQPKSMIVHLSWHGANEVYKCPFCNFSHTRSYIIEDHKKLHGYAGSFKCNQCSFATDEKYRLLKHKAMHFGRKTFKCDQCDYVTDNSHRLKIHTTRHSGQKTHMCPLCPFETMSKTDLKVHRLKHDANHSQKCKYCTYSCDNKKHLSKHLKLHENKADLRCLMCDFVATSECSLAWHEVNHHKKQQPVKPVWSKGSNNDAPTSGVNSALFGSWRYQRTKCPQCPFVAQDLHRLQDHVQKHGAGLPFKCTQCSYTCERETDLTQHSRYHGVKGAFVCQECSYSTEKKVCLLLHQASHAADGMYSCDRCDLKTSDKELLVSHLKEHDGTQVFRCSLCPYSTVIESNYTVHQRRHRARLLHCCKHCSYSTGKKKDMEAHNKMHERKFRCNECTYTTDIRYQFLIHRGLHTEKRIFSCDKCPFRTKAMVALRNHIVNQCNNNKLRCSECPFVTNRGAILKTHMKYHNANFKYKCDHCSFSTALGWHFHRHAKVHKRGTRQRQKPSTSSTEWHDSRSDKEEEKTEFEPSWTEGDHESDVDVENISEDYNADQSSHGRENRKTDETRNVTGESESTEAKVKDVSGPSPPTTSTPQETEKQQTVFNLVKSYASYHLSCRFCPYKTSKRLHHMSHEAKHGADLPFKCSKCSYSDRFEGKIAIHMRVHGCPGRYQCQHCYYSTNNEGFLQVHMNSRHRTSKVFHCSKCEFSTERPKYLKEHIQKQHLCKPLPTKVKVLEYKCIRCSFQAATLAELWEHHKLQHQEEEKHFYKDGDYRCRHCSFVATKQNRMARHIRIHLRDLAYTPQPTEGATSGLGNYAATHADGNTLGSDENNQEVGDESSAKNCNVISVEKSVVKSKNTARKSVPLGNKEKTTYQCPDCKFTATREHLVLAHARNTHRKEPDVEKQKVARYPRRFKLYKCQSCPYSSYRRIHVNIHEKYHSANYPFKCDQCTYSCQFLYKLLQHKALHDRGDNVYQAAVPKNITVYKCPLCPYTSYKKSVVQEHKTYHKAGYPHKCSKCSYSCKTDAKLQDHIKLHTQDDIVDQEGITMYQPPQREQVSLFKCSMCPYRSYKCQHVLCHERLHNANLPNKCRFCSYSSLFQYKVKQHQKLHEEEDGLSDTSKDASQNAVCSTMEDGEDVTTDEELQSEGIVSKKRGLNAVFDNSDRYPLRAEGRLSIRLFRCAKCHFYSKSWRLLQLHKAQHELKMIRSDSMKRSLPAAQPDREAEGGRYFCRYCPYGSTHISHVWRHEERHNAGLPFKCRYCSYSSLLEFWTDRHEAVHREERQVEAMQDIRNLQIQPEERSPVFAYGDDTLFAGIDTEEELATNSDGSDDTYSCKLCGRTFEEWRTYQHHARQHRQAGEEHVSHAVALGDPFTGRVFYVFTCKLCGRRFTGQVDWIQHMQHHRRNNRVPDRR
ncbi:uncharacterized protein LOC144910460 [Branchiostoma floridae x Branchiostoma belcheri]